MDKIKVMSFPASYGESLFVNIEKNEQNYNILIDCGFTNTYRKYIQTELLKRNKVNLLILTHIDDDHINGALELFSDKDVLKEIDIKEIWYNDLFKIAESKKIEYVKSTEQEFYDVKDKIENKSTFDEEVGYKKARNLSKSIINSGEMHKWNTLSDGLVQTDNGLYKEIELQKDIKMVLLSPHKKRLDELFLNWCDYLGLDSNKIIIDDKMMDDFYKYFFDLDKQKEVSKFDEECSSEEFDIVKLAELSFNKESITNNTSIAFFIETQGKKMLFLGDSNPEDVQASLNRYIEDKVIDKIDFELVKVSHHGSKYNINSDFFRTLSSKRYLISTNGKKFKHPDLECLSKIIVNQGNFKKLYFNYYHKKVHEKLDNEELKSLYKYEIQMPDSSDIDKILTIEL